MSKRLTKPLIDRLAWDATGPQTQITYGTEVRGLGVRLRKNGRKTFVLWVHPTGGRRWLMTIGDYGVMTLKQARDRAKRELLAALDGEDVVARRKTVRKELDREKKGRAA